MVIPAGETPAGVMVPAGETPAGVWEFKINVEKPSSRGDGKAEVIVAGLSVVPSFRPEFVNLIE